jgi:hypothetical protein
MDTTTRTTESIFADHTDFQIGPVTTSSHRRQCNELVNAMYSWRGYGEQREMQERSPYELTLQALRAGRVIATMTVCRDSLSGIPADALYKAEINRYRGRGASVCEFTRLAVDPSERCKDLLGALFYHAYMQGCICNGVTDSFIEVNPRHVAFYKRLLSFAQIGEEKTCDRVNAPAVLLHRKIAGMGQQIADYRKRPRAGTAPAQLDTISATTRSSTSERQVALAA